MQARGTEARRERTSGDREINTTTETTTMHTIDIITAAILFAAWSYVIGDVAGRVIDKVFTR